MCASQFSETGDHRNIVQAAVVHRAAVGSGPRDDPLIAPAAHLG